MAFALSLFRLLPIPLKKACRRLSRLLKNREQKFIDNALRYRLLGQAPSGAIVGVVYHLSSLVLSQWLYFENWQRVMRPVHIACLVGVILTFSFFRKRSSLLQAGHFINDLVLFVGLNLACYLNRITAGIPHEQIVAGEALLLIVAVIITLTAHVTKPMARLRIVAFLPLCMPGLAKPVGSPVVDVWLWIAPAIFVASYVLWSKSYDLAIDAARSEFRRLSGFTPSAVIDRAMISDSDVADIFKPTTRFCVCLCSDWRSYQSMTSKMTPDAVVSALELYYEATSELLQHCFPKGNYFSDWIADELFVVAFVDEGTSEREVASCALNFAQALLAKRVEIAASIGVPKAIDIGIASGLASVGIVGPTLNRKATALGEVPGRSRRLQTSAKGLRQQHGDKDRCVIGFEVVELCGSIANLQSFEVGADELRDLRDSKLYYIDSAA